MKSPTFKINFSNLFISICGLGLLIFTYKALNIRLQPILILFLTIGIAAIYNVSISIQLIRKIITIVSFFTVFIKTAIAILLSIFLFGFVILITNYLTFHGLLFLLLGFILSILYQLPILKYKNKRIRLKQISYLKVPLIALVWTIVTILIPILANEINPAQSSLLITNRFFFIFSLAIPFDIRDIEQDKKSNTQTYVVKWNSETAKIIAIISLFIYLVCVYIDNGLIFNIKLSLYFSGLIAFIMILLSSKDRTKLFFKYGVDGILLVPILIYWMLAFLKF